jgi:hypothetical protein
MRVKARKPLGSNMQDQHCSARISCIQVGRFRAANRHFKQVVSIAEYDGFKAPLVGGLPRAVGYAEARSASFESFTYMVIEIAGMSLIHRINALINISMKTRMRPVDNFSYIAMLDRIPMDVIHMIVKIGLVT